MMHRRTIKMPDGRLVAARPDPLARLLAQQPLPRYAATPAPARPGNTDSQSSGRRDYHTESFDIRRLAGAQLTVFGAGSVGSHVVSALGPAGCKINVVDNGTVKSRHTQGGRTAYEAIQIGLKKVSALKEKIERDHPGTILRAYPYHTSEIPDSQIKIMVQVSLAVILAIDDPREMLRIAELVYPITEPVQPAMHARGATGHIVICFPFVTPCLRCSLGVNEATDIRRLDSEPAAGLDITTVSLLASRVVLDIAYSKVTGQPITRWDPAKNLIFIANSKHEMSPDGPGFHFESSRKRPGCPVCNNPAA
jgi:hypothetical protein